MIQAPRAQFQWQQPTPVSPPTDWQRSLARLIDASGGDPDWSRWLGPILWQRGWRDLALLPGFLSPTAYQPTPPAAFGAEMTQAIARLVRAYERQEKVAIWGDFDADGLTATAVLWEGLGQFFTPHEQLRYYVPHRFTESHGLSRAGLEALAAWGCTLLVTCDTGSTAEAELAYAQSLGMAVIVTDHHTLPDQRPPVVALINPRQLPEGHPLADLSGVAVAYKLVEALYEQLPQVPQQPLETLLDLVAIGLIADLVNLRGDCRYLTQVGLQQLKHQARLGVRPGIAKLLEFCKRSGDRPSDVAFGLGPRINAVSRIHGDARFGVELLTSRDRPRAEALALEAELANTRRKALQASVLQEVTAQLSQLDLSTTQVIVLSDPQWSPGVLGLVASQVAQTYGRPTLLFQTETTPEPGNVPLARGSARSVHGIDLYELVRGQAHLLTRFGGHPYAAGLTLPVEHLPLLREGINRALRSQGSPRDLTQPPPLSLDLEVTVADLGKDLFRALKLLEPYGMGHPIPRLLIRNVQIDNSRDETLRDKRGGKQRYHKLSFDIRDPDTQAVFPGHWWGHRRHDLPQGRYDLVVELDVNTYRQQYEARLVDAQSTDVQSPIVSWQTRQATTALTSQVPPSRNPAVHLREDSWQTAAALPYWQQLVGMAKYLARTGEARPLSVIQAKLAVSDRTLQIGLYCLTALGLTAHLQDEYLTISPGNPPPPPADYRSIATQFLRAVQEEHFRRDYHRSLAPLLK